jgi:hypothetical protein
MYRDTAVNYLQILNQVKNKLPFGKDKHSLTIDFAWKDTLDDSKYTSNSIYFEYYSVLFNIGIVYFETGKSSMASEDDLKFKEGVKQFQTAAWIFDRIKEEYQLYIQVGNIQPDLQMSYMSFVSLLIRNLIIFIFFIFYFYSFL